jgi:hypothetical protein
MDTGLQFVTIESFHQTSDQGSMVL